MSKETQYRKRPALVKGYPRSKMVNERGEYVPDPVPHPDLLMNPKPISLAEQVRNLERLGVVTRVSLLDKLNDDDFGDGWVDDMEQPLTEYELAGMSPKDPPQKVPKPNVSGEKNAQPSAPSAPAATPNG